MRAWQLEIRNYGGGGGRDLHFSFPSLHQPLPASSSLSVHRPIIWTSDGCDHSHTTKLCSCHPRQGFSRSLSLSSLYNTHTPLNLHVRDQRGPLAGEARPLSRPHDWPQPHRVTADTSTQSPPPRPSSSAAASRRKTFSCRRPSPFCHVLLLLLCGRPISVRARPASLFS